MIGRRPERIQQSGQAVRVLDHPSPELLVEDHCLVQRVVTDFGAGLEKIAERERIEVDATWIVLLLEIGELRHPLVHAGAPELVDLLSQRTRFPLTARQCGLKSLDL